MATAFPEEDYQSNYGTVDCPIRRKLRFCKERLITFESSPRNLADEKISTLAKDGLFYSGLETVFCIWCLAMFNVYSYDTERHANQCPKRHLRGELDDQGSMDKPMNSTDNTGRGKLHSNMEQLLAECCCDLSQSKREEMQRYRHDLVSRFGFSDEIVIQAIIKIVEEAPNRGVGFQDINHAIQTIARVEKETVEARYSEYRGRTRQTSSSTQLKDVVGTGTSVEPEHFLSNTRPKVWNDSSSCGSEQSETQRTVTHRHQSKSTTLAPPKTSVESIPKGSNRSRANLREHKSKSLTNMGLHHPAGRLVDKFTHNNTSKAEKQNEQEIVQESPPKLYNVNFTADQNSVQIITLSGNINTKIPIREIHHSPQWYEEVAGPLNRGPPEESPRQSMSASSTSDVLRNHSSNDDWQANHGQADLNVSAPQHGVLAQDVALQDVDGEDELDSRSIRGMKEVHSSLGKLSTMECTSHTEMQQEDLSPLAMRSRYVAVSNQSTSTRIETDQCCTHDINTDWGQNQGQQVSVPNAGLSGGPAEGTSSECEEDIGKRRLKPTINDCL